MSQTVDRPVVLFIDLQEGLVDASRTNAPTTLRRTAGWLARLAAALELPVYASVIPAGPAGAPPLIREVVAPLAHLQTDLRMTMGAFEAGPCRDTLARAPGGRGTLIIAGIATEVAVLHTALAARRAGHVVQLVVDAIGGLSERTERAALEQLRAAGVEVTAFATLATAQPVDFGSETGARVRELLGELLAAA